MLMILLSTNSAITFRQFIFYYNLETDHRTYQEYHKGESNKQKLYWKKKTSTSNKFW